MSRYIDSEELIEKVNNRSTHLLNEWDTLGVLAVIDETPTADVEKVRHGEWICQTEKIASPNYYEDYNECSECGETFDLDFLLAIGISKFNYCPSCGAKMDGGAQ